MIKIFLVVLTGLTLLTACQEDETGRWYSTEQVAQGEKVFAQYCAACHGYNAEATANWKQTDANGNYPPPPLNGTAHAWHHSLAVLRQQIREGGAPVGGVMPAFKQVLSAQEIDQTIAYFQSKWPDELYQRWRHHVAGDSLPAINNN